MAITESRLLDLLAEAVSRYKREGSRGIDWTFDHMSDQDRLAFDLWLVRVKDPLAYEPGTTEHRFRTRVRAMAENVPASLLLKAEEA